MQTGCVASQILPFVLVTIPVLLMPGPDLLLVLRNSAIGGRHGGAATAAGTVTGLLVHATGAALGLSALLAASAEAFTVVKLIGAGYLLYMGVQSLRAAAARAHDVGAGPTGTAAEQLGRQAFRQGLLTNVLNPKIAAFFLAFLPQFVDPARGPAWTQILVLGAVLALLGLISDSLYALAAARAGGWLRRHPRVLGRERYLSGTVYVGLGVGAALTGENRLATSHH